MQKSNFWEGRTWDGQGGDYEGGFGVQPGEIVTLQHLRRMYQLNGARGKFVSFDRATGLCQIRLAEARLRVPLRNLREGEALLQQHHRSQNRWPSVTDCLGSHRHHHHSILEHGPYPDWVTLQHLREMQEFNGKRAKLYDIHTNLVCDIVLPDAHIQVRPENITGGRYFGEMDGLPPLDPWGVGAKRGGPGFHQKSIAALALLPWGMFAFVCTAFALAPAKHQWVAWLFALFFLAFAGLLCGVGARSFRQGPMYYFLGGLGFFAVFAGVLVGLWINARYFQGYWAYRTRDTYSNVQPTEPAAARYDAAVLGFTDETHLDTTQTLGILDMGVRYCVAPVLGGAGPGDGDAVEYWAIGVDCCEHNGGFDCDDALVPEARTGIVVLSTSKGHDVFQRAVAQAAAFYKLGAPEEPVLLRWVEDAEDFMRRQLIHGILSLVLAVLLFLVLSIVVGALLHVLTGRRRNQTYGPPGPEYDSPGSGKPGYEAPGYRPSGSVPPGQRPPSWMGANPLGVGPPGHGLPVHMSSDYRLPESPRPREYGPPTPMGSEYGPPDSTRPHHRHRSADSRHHHEPPGSPRHSRYGPPPPMDGHRTRSPNRHYDEKMGPRRPPGSPQSSGYGLPPPVDGYRTRSPSPMEDYRTRPPPRYYGSM